MAFYLIMAYRSCAQVNNFASRILLWGKQTDVCLFHIAMHWFKSKALFLQCIVTPFCPHIIDDLLTTLYTSLCYCIASMLWAGYGGILTRATLLMILVMARGLHLQISINNINCALFVNLHIPFSLQLAFCSIAKSLKDILPFSIFDWSSQFVSVAPCLTWSLHYLHLLRLRFAHFCIAGSTSIWTIILALYRIRCSIIPCHVCVIYRRNI